MDRPPHRIAHLYGYVVCLIAITVALFHTTSLVDNLLTLAHPLDGGTDFRFASEPSLTSFEAYKATSDRARWTPPNFGNSPVRADSIPDAERLARYTTLRADRISQNRLAAQRGIIKNVLFLVLAWLLFRFHWRWLKRIPDDVPPRPGQAP